MKKWKKWRKWREIRKSWLLAAVTGVSVVGMGIGALANASGMQSIFEPNDFGNFENQYDSGENYESVAGDGEESDLADENEDGEDSTDKDTQKALQVAENDSENQDGTEDGLGMADDRSHANDPAQEKNPDAFEITNDGGPGGIDVMPGSGTNGNAGSGFGGNSGNGGNGTAAPGRQDITGVPGTTRVPKPTATTRPTNVPNPTNAGNPTDVPQPTGTLNPTDVPKPTNTPRPTGTAAPTSTPEPTVTETPPPTETPTPTTDDTNSGTPTPTGTPSPTATPWEEGQLKPRDPVNTENGVLIGLSASFYKKYYYREELFQDKDAEVRAHFLQPDGTPNSETLHYGGENGYSVKISTGKTGAHTATFSYLGFTARADYNVTSNRVNVCYHRETKDGIYPTPFPGALNDKETSKKLSDVQPLYPSSDGIVDLTEQHSRMIAYLGENQDIWEELDENIRFLEEEDGYLKTMLCGFKYCLNNALEERGPYVYYPVDPDPEWGSSRSVVNKISEVPDGYKIKRVVSGKDTVSKDGYLADYMGSQVLVKYTGNDTTLSVPMGVTGIELEGGQGNGNVTSLILPESVSINEINFASVSKCLPVLEAYKVLENPVYQAVDGVLYSKDGKTLYSVPAGKTDVSILNTVTTIESGAFQNSNIKKLDIPGTVAELKKDCFDGLSKDAVIRMRGKKVPEILSDTGFSGKILFADSDYDVLLKRGMLAFKSQNIIFGAMDENGAEISGKTEFYQYDSERHILTLKDNTEVLAGSPGNTYGRYIVPKGITAVGESAFAEADGLREIEVPAAVKELRKGSLIFSESVKEIFLRTDTMEISNMVFGDPADGAKVPDIIVYVPEKFYGEYLENWSQVLDPAYGEGTAKKLLQVDDGTAFYENDAMYRKVSKDGAEQYRLVKVYAKDKTAFRVKEGTAEIEAGAFALCGSLEILYLPDALDVVGDGAFTGCGNLQTVTVKDAQLLSGNVFDPMCKDVNIYEKGSRFSEFIYDQGILYGKSVDDVYTLLDVPTDYAGDIRLYENTGILNEEAFKGCILLKDIDIPDPNALVEIGDRCFENCTAVKNLRFDKAVHLERVGEEAFRSCTSLELLYLPEHLSETGKGLCYDCTSLWYVNARGISRVGEEMFFNCRSLPSDLEKYVLLNWHEMTGIGDYGFAYCTQMASIPDMPKLESLGEWAFFTCQRLKKVVLPETLTTMGEECFGECSSLTQVEMNGKLTGISRYCFYGCRELVKIEFSEQQKSTLQVVGVQAFGQCIALESLDLSEFPILRQMGERTFEGCNFLTKVKLPENLSRIPDYCFAGCQNLSVLALLSDGVIELGEAVFGDGDEFEFPPFINIWVKEEKLADYRDAYKSVLDQAYGEGTAEKVLGKIEENKELIRGITFEITDEGRILKEVSEAFEGDYTVPIDTHRIAAEAFMNCEKLMGLTLPDDSSIVLEDRCFKGCTALERVELYGNIPQWGEETFMDCTSLKKLEIGGGTQDEVPRVGTRAFKGCTGLEGRNAVTFRAKMPILGEECFAGCTNLGAIPMVTTGTSIIPTSTTIEVLEDRAFEGCTNLTQFLTTSFTGVKTIGAYAFSNCDSLVQPSVPAAVESIGEGAFSECEKLKYVSFYCELEEYPKNCFKNCKNLIRTGGVANALSGLKKIGEGAYEGCSSLTTNASWNLGKYSNLEEIGANAFRDCTSMTDINLAKTVWKIGDNVFDNCVNISQMTLNSPEPPEIGRISLETLSKDFCIKVPDSQSDEDSIYKAYLAVLTEMFENDQVTAYNLLDSISDGAKERNPLSVPDENSQPDDAGQSTYNKTDRNVLPKDPEELQAIEDDEPEEGREDEDGDETQENKIEESKPQDSEPEESKPEENGPDGNEPEEAEETTE